MRRTNFLCWWDRLVLLCIYRLHLRYHEAASYCDCTQHFLDGMESNKTCIMQTTLKVKLGCAVETFGRRDVWNRQVRITFLRDTTVIIDDRSRLCIET